MTQEITEFKFNNQSVIFDLSQPSIMVNATQMAKLFNRRIDFFLKTEETKAYIKEMIIYSKEKGEPLTEKQICYAVKNGATWMHRVLALKFAAWLNPKFELWVYSTIEKILLGDYVLVKTQGNEVAALMEELREIESRENILYTELIKNETYLEFVEVGKKKLALQKTIKDQKERMVELLSTNPIQFKAF